MSPTVFGTFSIVLLLPTHNGSKLWKKRASRLEKRHLWHIVEVCFYIVAGRNMNSLMVSVRTETLCRYIPTAPLSLYAIVVMIIVIYLAS